MVHRPEVGRIAVIGHRKLEVSPSLVTAVDAALDRARTLCGSPERIELLSPLADGSDRLVAAVALEHADTSLIAVLPLPKNDYLQDFTTPDSRAEFEGLLARAARVETPPSSRERTRAYAAVGRDIVDRCDVLVALWDGRPPRGVGGTGETVDYARRVGRPIVWVALDDDGSARLKELR